MRSAVGAGGGLGDLGARRRAIRTAGSVRGIAGFEAAGLVLGLEHHVALERFADLRLEFEDRQLQQADGLLQLRGHRELLAESELQGWLEHSSRNFGSRSGACRSAARSRNICSNASLQSEILAQVHLTDLPICKDLFRSSRGDHRTAADDVGARCKFPMFPARYDR